nr:MAG TPA: transmembrane protein [Caudoviricetes sp.]
MKIKINLDLLGLCLLFIILKLTGIITWNWILVLAPIWIPLVISAFIIVFGLILSIMVALLALLGVK